MVMNAPAVRMCTRSPKVPARLARYVVATCPSRKVSSMISATRKSFQVHRNWKIAKAASAGTDSGMMSRQNVWKCPAPSTFADSMTSLGSDPM